MMDFVPLSPMSYFHASSSHLTLSSLDVMPYIFNVDFIAEGQVFATSAYLHDLTRLEGVEEWAEIINQCAENPRPQLSSTSGREEVA